MRDSMCAVLRAACAGRAISESEAERLLSLLPGVLTDIVAVAGAARVAGGTRAFTCGIINAKSGRCGEDCAFCAQSRHHDAAAPVYPLVDEETLLERAEQLAQSGVTYMGIVTGGVGPAARDFERICRAARRIAREVGIKLCASLGLLEEGQALALKHAGFTSYHHNLECARSYYSRICTTHSYERRRETVQQARDAGLRTCTGGIFGLGESWRQRLELSADLRTLNVDSIPVNFLTPIAGTPLEHAPGLHAGEALALIALLRLMHPGKDILICGGRTRTLGEWENSLFFAGANGLMVGDYLTLKGNALADDMRMLRTLGLARDV
ncbi:MAG: biotin synthase BioB [Desulfovibrio sp.]|jgi:biotin synthase|nr:biotin synthase BioB [Desulfovibrio sp.]